VWATVAAVVLLAAAGALLATGVIRLPAQQAAPPPAPTPWPTATLRPRNTPAAAVSLSCQGPFEGWADLESAWLGQPVTLDGRITRAAEEWSDTPCVDLVLTNPEGGHSIASTWWLKNDSQWLYLLARLPIAEGEVSSVQIDCFWPRWENGWRYSDSGWIDQDNNSRDSYGWDEERWYDDIEASPAGRDDVQGAATADGTYLWFEWRKPLDSGDGYDWAWAPGDTIAADESSLLIGAWDGVWHQINISLRLGEP